LDVAPGHSPTSSRTGKYDDVLVWASSMYWKKLEIKLFVVMLMQHFAFELEEPIAKFSAVLTTPYVADQFSRVSKLPLRVRRYVV
jgi:hypothetical protein